MNEVTPVTAIGGNAVIQTATITSGQSLSDAVDLGISRLSMIVMPSAWTAASLTLQASVDGETYSDVYDQFGNEVVISASTSRAILLTLQDFLAARYIKLRSGMASSADPQGADRAIKVIGVK